jgi:hypothetical protein
VVSVEHNNSRMGDGYRTGDGDSGNPTALENRTASIDEWEVQTLRDDNALSRLAADWNDLYERCSPVPACVSHAWLECWWRNYGDRAGGSSSPYAVQVSLSGRPR